MGRCEFRTGRKTVLCSKLGLLLAVVIPMVLSIGACRKSDNASDPNAISNRPQNFDRFIAIIRLSEKPLLETATRVSNDVAINPVQRQRILDEQEEFIDELTTAYPQVEILNQYRLVLNGIVVVAPIHLKEAFREFPQVSYIETSQTFTKAPVVDNDDLPQGNGATPDDIDDENSTVFIGADRVHTGLATRGAGMRVGVIDTGIDYTHKAFGGPGTRSAWLHNNRDIVEPGTFPTQKVVAGIDLVGATYNPGSPNFDDHVPVPDNDPLDRQGHGTHVAGTVAGKGDGVHTYDGVAPDADLVAIKVFSDGMSGSTSDFVIIAALEYAVDPNGDLDPADRLDVVNLSLGSPFGTRHVLYEEALKNLVVGGDVVAACSAGNSGDLEYIVGAPSTVPEAISVAASIDDTVSNGSLTDQLAPFSSRGPRSIDGLFKPEIAAPGYQILSAAVGRGDRGNRKSGTSMAAPHIAGVSALLRELRPDADAATIKSLMINSSKSIRDGNNATYPLALQGGGRVQTYAAATTSLVFSPSTISLGVVELQGSETLTKAVEITNTSSSRKTLSLSSQTTRGLTIQAPSVVTIEAGETKRVTLRYTIRASQISETSTTLDGVILVREGSDLVARLPAMAVTRQHAKVNVTDVSRSGSRTTVELSNGGTEGSVALFRKIATDDIHQVDASNPSRTVPCDLQSAGYRVVQREVDGSTRNILQIAVNLQNAVTTWHLCEVSIQVDGNGDGQPEQELLGTYLSTLSDRYDNADARFFSFLMSWDRMVQARGQLERDYDLDRRTVSDYVGSAMIDYQRFVNLSGSTLAIVEADVSRLSRNGAGRFAAKIGILSGNGTEPEADDFLQGQNGREWFVIDPAIGDLGESATGQISAGGTGELRANADADDLILYVPHNRGTGSQRAISL